jgi:hypothetical protein
VQPDDPLLSLVAEVAKHGVLDHHLQIGPVFPLGKDAVAEGAGVETAFDCFSYLEYDL